ncbi:hypothetical protein IFM89_037724, partial [Coptis chinensis]
VLGRAGNCPRATPFPANVAKNVAAVTSTSTRTPIYKAFAKGENIGDVTAKGECVGNIADLVKSVVLRTLNRARFTLVVESFLETGDVPSLQNERYIVTYNPLKGNIYALLKDKAKSDDILKAAYHAHVLLHFIRSSDKRDSSVSKHNRNGLLDFIESLSTHHSLPTTIDIEAHIAESCKIVSSSYGVFKKKASEQVLIKEVLSLYASLDAMHLLVAF